VLYKGVVVESGTEQKVGVFLQKMYRGGPRRVGKILEELLNTYKNLIRNIVYSGGQRGEIPISKMQKKEIVEYAKLYGVKEEDIHFFSELETQNTGYKLYYGIQDRLQINSDVMPGNLNTANSRLSWKAAIAHELEGHRAGELSNNTFLDIDLSEGANNLLEEMQASIRASKHGKNLSLIERSDLLDDAFERYTKHNNVLKGTKYENYTFNQIQEILWTSKN